MEEVWSVLLQAHHGEDLLPSVHHQVPGPQLQTYQVSEESRQEICKLHPSRYETVLSGKGGRHGGRDEARLGEHAGDGRV